MGAPRTSSESMTGRAGKSPFKTRTLPIIVPYALDWAESCRGTAKDASIAIHNRTRKFLFMASPDKKSTTTKGKRACSPTAETSPRIVPILPLEAELQSELHVASVQSAGSLAKVGIVVLVVRSPACGREDEIGAVEYVERIVVELHVDPFGDLEVLG